MKAKQKSRAYSQSMSLTFLSLISALFVLLTSFSARAQAETRTFDAGRASALPLARAAQEVQARFSDETRGASTRQGRGDAFRSALSEVENPSPPWKSARTSVGRGLPLQMGARFYAPALGIWTSPDPVVVDDPEMLVSGEYATAHPYVYANLNPVNAKDADGNFWHVAAGAGIGALMGGGMEAATQYLKHGEVKDWGRVGSAAAGGAVFSPLV